MGAAGRRIVDALGSRRLAIALLLAVAAAGLYGSLEAGWRPPPDAAGWRTGRAARLVGIVETYRSPPFVALLAALAASVVACTVPRFRSLARSRIGGARRARLAGLDLLMHLGVVLALAGGAAKGAFGTILTGNLHVGDATATAFDWRSGRDVPLGFTVLVRERAIEHHPARVRVGVRSAAGEKVALLEIAEGESAPVPGRAVALRLVAATGEPPRFRLREEGAAAGGEFELDAGEEPVREAVRDGLAYVLVAYRRDVRSVRAHLRLLEGGSVVREGWLGVNGRLGHRGTGLFLTAWGSDEEGRPFVGLQYVRDPGAPLFWVGCVLFAALSPAYLMLRHRGGGGGE